MISWQHLLAHGARAFIEYHRRQQVEREREQERERRMTYADKYRYDTLKARLGSFGLSEKERENIASEMAKIIDKY